MKNNLLFIAITHSMLWANMHGQDAAQQKFIFAVQSGDEKTVRELINKADLTKKDAAGIRPLRLLAQQAVPVEDTWLQLKYLRFQLQPIPEPSAEEKKVAQKLRGYLNIAKLLVDLLGARKDLEPWDRRWYGDYEGQWEPNRYPLNSAKFGVDQEETANKKRFVHEQNQLAHFYNRDQIRLKD